MTCNMTRQDSLRPLLEGQRQQHDRGSCSSGLGSIFGEIGDVPSLCAEQSRSQCELLAQSTRFCNGCPGILYQPCIRRAWRLCPASTRVRSRCWIARSTPGFPGPLGSVRGSEALVSAH
jgi:hypothetical protein